MKIKSIKKIDRCHEDVYNIEVEDNHNYYANDILVSNCHGLKTDKFGKAVIGLISKTANAHYRLGTTGTIENTNMHRLQIEGMFGTIYKPTTTRELIDRGLLAGVHIKVVKLKYPDEISGQLNKLDWNLQQDFVENVENPRQKVIVDLAISLKENCLILFRKIEHGTFIYEELLKNCKKEIYYVDGGVKSLDRNDIRRIVETKKDSIIVASFGVFSAGVNIKNLHHLIMGSSTKSQVRLFQSIGRSLRLHESKSKATIYDFVDRISYLENHYAERKKLYKDEQLTFDEREIDLIAWCNKKNIDFF
jgi:superfamily II DNA or RNA helicase